MKSNYNQTLTIVVSFLLVIILSIIPKTNNEIVITKERILNNSLNSIDASISDNYTKINKIELSNDIINILYEDIETGDYKSFFIDKNSGDIVSYTSLFKNNTKDLFTEREIKLLNEKYPKFIVDGILNSDTKREVFIYKNSLKIQYNNVITNPMYSDKLYLTINYNEINDLLDYEYNLDSTYKNESGYDYDPTKKYIAFTFDDGPNRKNTNDIVNYLNDNKMRATFFMVGYLAESNSDIVKNVYDNNMEIGSHSWSHKNLKKQKKQENLDNEMNKVDEVLSSIIGKKIDLMRPPYGAINDDIKNKYSYSYILWNVDTNDWKYKDSEHLYDFVINNVEDGDIVLMHDLQYTTKVGIEKILPELYVRGYRVVTVSELANIKNIELNKNEIYRSLK